MNGGFDGDYGRRSTRGSLCQSLIDTAQRWESDKEREMKLLRNQLATANERAAKESQRAQTEIAKSAKAEGELKVAEAKLNVETQKSQVRRTRTVLSSARPAE